MTDIQQSVRAALVLLEDVQRTEAEAPATVVMPPDSDGFIIGNAQGFVNLAIASLKAAQGQEQSFKNQPWWVNYELDWSLPGLRPDSSAHLYLPVTRGGLRQLGHKALGYGVFSSCAICLVVGLVVILRWLVHVL